MSSAKHKKSLTTSMKLDVLGFDEDLDVISAIPELKKMKSWVEYPGEPLTRNQIAKYIVILYSDDSILNLRNPLPLDDRKDQALALAGIDKTAIVEKELLFLNNPVYLKMIHDFLINQDDILWMELVTTEEQYNEAIRLRLSPAGTGKMALAAADLKKKLREECKVMVNDIKTYYRKFYSDHEDVKEKVKELPSSLETIAQGAKHV